MILPILFALPSSEDGNNVTLDDERLQDEVPKGLQKVELDLDDALFLEVEDTPPPPEDAPEEPSEKSSAPPLAVRREEAGKSFWKSRRIWVGGLVVAVLLVAVVAYVFFRAMRPEPQPGIEPAKAAAENVTAAEEGNSSNQTANRTVPPKPSYSFAPFVVEYAQGDRVRFLTCRFSVRSTQEILIVEMQARQHIVRDAVYRYLKNTDLAFLDDPENSDKLKQDLLTVLNQVLRSGKVEELLLEEYVVR